MMEITILGSGCARCESLEKITRKAVDELGLDAVVTKTGDIEEILNYEIMRTPALVIGGKVVLTGKVPSMVELKSLLINMKTTT